MTKRIYILARTVDPYAGGGLIRLAQAQYFCQQGYKCIFVIPDYGQKLEDIQFDTIVVKTHRSLRVSSVLQRIGLLDDYLHEWGAKSIGLLQNVVNKEDVILASSGGELTSLKIGSVLKTLRGCRYIANLHDPVAYSHIEGFASGTWPLFHVRRGMWERKYLMNADLILTSTQSFAEALKRKYRDIAQRIDFMYFGYPKPMEISIRNPGESLRVAYGGIFSAIQAPEILAKAATGSLGIDVIYIGNWTSYRPVSRLQSQVTLVESMPHAGYLEYLKTQIDVGFVSLSKNEYHYCIPSKIYEYINAGVPILGALPPGEARTLINGNGLGIAVGYDDVDGMRLSLQQFRDATYLKQIRRRIREVRSEWSLTYQMAQCRSLHRALNSNS